MAEKLTISFGPEDELHMLVKLSVVEENILKQTAIQAAAPLQTVSHIHTPRRRTYPSQKGSFFLSEPISTIFHYDLLLTSPFHVIVLYTYTHSRHPNLAPSARPL